jgi:hypothetical protein
VVVASSVPHSRGPGDSATKEPAAACQEIADVSMDGQDGYAASRHRITQGGCTRTCPTPLS